MHILINNPDYRPRRAAADLALVLTGRGEADIAQEDVSRGGEVGHGDARHQEDREGRRVCKV